jgi:filamentous hemagglutinin
VPNIGALATANNAAGAAAKTDTPTGNTATDQPSIILVEFLGFGGGDGTPRSGQDNDRSRKGSDHHSYDPNSRLQIIGVGALTDEQKQQLAEPERHRLIGQ